jgi:hypothetical protein
VNLTTEQKKKVATLVKEGAIIADIKRDHFPKFSYRQIQSVVDEKTDGGSLGLKRKISNRLKELKNTNSKAQKDAAAKKITELVNSLYKQHKEMRGKLADIRDALD